MANASEKPAWLVLNDRIAESVIRAAHDHLAARRGTNLTLNLSAYLPAIHFAHCLDASVHLNRHGQHAPALCLIRQCVESLTIIDAGLQSIEYGDPLLLAWEQGKKTQGDVRATLQRDVWPRYGTGLWSESWAEFFGNLARAVQPYAHYTPELQRWQHAVPVGQKLDESHSFLVQVGMNVYDPQKASRLTLFHVLLVWVLGRYLVANGCSVETFTAGDVETLGIELARSEFLDGPRSKWPELFYPHIFFR